jgi:type I restriction enzyme S subunit
MKILEKIKNCKVEWRELGDVAELKRGRVISKRYLQEHPGQYPVYSSQTANNGIIGRIDTYDYEGEYVNWTTDGANAGTVFYRKGKFSITNVSGLVKIKDDVNLDYKFLYYWLSIVAKKYVYSGMGNPKLMSNQMAKVTIPIPPLEIQREIVKILDKFTELTTELTIELTTELTLRKRQYEYYRNKLLTFKDDEVEWRELGEVLIEPSEKKKKNDKM